MGIRLLNKYIKNNCKNAIKIILNKKINYKIMNL